jgi:hypothetical protein
MALPLEAYLWARIGAKYHLQVEVVDRGPIGDSWSPVPTRFRVVRVFKGGTGLIVGKEFYLSVKVCPSGRFPPPDAGGWLQADEYLRGRFYEVYLDEELGPATPPVTPAVKYQVAACGAEIYVIDGPTESPKVKCPTREEAEAEEARFRAR